MSTPLFSIIIPVYNGHDVIGRALDSIYSQCLSEDQFEVICVDDCSPALDTFNAINNYLYQGVHPANLKSMRHEVNKRQGGARNTGIRCASGDWVVFLDQDDFLVEECLAKIVHTTELIENLDLFMLCHRVQNLKLNTLVKGVFMNSNNDSVVMSGCEYICRNQVGWAPWCYIYSREYLIKKGLFFEEGVRWEDLDFVMRAILNASKMSFVPIEMYHYLLTGQNTSIMGNDKARIEDWMKMSIRVKKVAEQFSPIHKEASMMVMNHHIHHYAVTLKTILWRLSYTEIMTLLRNYPPYAGSSCKLVNLTLNNPYIYAIFASLLRPLLLFILWIRDLLR